MTRVKRGMAAKQRHKRLLKKVKGFWGQRNNIFKRAQETLLRSMAFAYKGRKLLKRDMRALFITRINAAVATHGISYSRFMSALKKSDVALNRKMLSQLAIFEPQGFAAVVAVTKQQ